MASIAVIELSVFGLVEYIEQEKRLEKEDAEAQLNMELTKGDVHVTVRSQNLSKCGCSFCLKLLLYRQNLRKCGCSFCLKLLYRKRARRGRCRSTVKYGAH